MSSSSLRIPRQKVLREEGAVCNSGSASTISTGLEEAERSGCARVEAVRAAREAEVLGGRCQKRRGWRAVTTDRSRRSICRRPEGRDWVQQGPPGAIVAASSTAKADAADRLWSDSYKRRSLRPNEPEAHARAPVDVSASWHATRAWSAWNWHDDRSACNAG